MSYVLDKTGWKKCYGDEVNFTKKCWGLRKNLIIWGASRKSWEGVVGRPEIQKFAGALQGQRARKGIFITTSNFTKDALNYVENIDTKIILIDGQRLAELMIAYNVGANTTAIYEVKKIDSDYFIED